MKVVLQRPVWYSADLTRESLEAVGLLSGVWKEACLAFVATTKLRLANGRKPPMGIQPFINSAIDERFLAAGWDGRDSKFRKGNTLVLISFRHQMSLGSDLYSAVWLSKKEEIEQVLLLAGTLEFLRIVTPQDASSLTSFERYCSAISQMTGAFDPPLIIGGLDAESKLGEREAEVIYGSRLKKLRD